MTVYNDLRFLDEAVTSILEQEFGDLELVIVDDGTGEDAIFNDIARRDPRIRVIVNPTNIGAGAAANRGIEAARSEIIVRLDGDDVAEPDRVGRLVSALETDPDLGLVGSWVTMIDEAGQPHWVARTPETDLDIRWTLLFHNPFYHSAVAFRRACFDSAGRYRSEERVSYDHYLWFDMLPHCRARNIPEPLARYRMNTRGLIATNAVNARSRTHAIRESLWSQFDLRYDLYDDTLARDASEFLRGKDIPVARRFGAYRKLVTVLGAFLATQRSPGRADDGRASQRLARGLVRRMLASPPDHPRELLVLMILCWRFDWRELIRVGGRRAASGLGRERRRGVDAVE
jgi:glycosyltransferase involved in cell wall biosynthesis